MAGLFPDEELEPLHYKWVGREWGSLLEPEFLEVQRTVLPFLTKRKKEVRVYPDPVHVFNAYTSNLPQNVKVVILGQDPYHDGSAHGLAFSSLNKFTPSLRVIANALKHDGYELKNHNLMSWSLQGVLLLNTILTVEAGKPLSHKGLGWEQLTTSTLRVLIQLPQPIVFLLWGREAQNTFTQASKGLSFSSNKCVIKTAHPAADLYSGGAAGFANSGCFAETNRFLIDHGCKEIFW
jgi:uracil-DNA glycosylase